MIEDACFIRDILVYALMLLFGICIISWIIFYISKNKKFVNASTIVLLGVGFSVVLINLFIERKIREEIKFQLKSNGVQGILINDELSKIELNTLKENFLRIEKGRYERGSTSTNEFKIDIISSEEKYTFTLLRNSYEPTKYRVETDKYDYELDVGMIRTSILDEMK